MNQTSQEVRKIFIKLKNDGISKEKLMEFTGKCRRTIENWLKLSNEELLKNANKVTNSSKNIEKLKQIFEANATKFHKQLEDQAGLKKTKIGYWRKKLGFKRKKAQTTYKEADEVKKKNL